MTTKPKIVKSVDRISAPRCPVPRPVASVSLKDVPRIKIPESGVIDNGEPFYVMPPSNALFTEDGTRMASDINESEAAHRTEPKSSDKSCSTEMDREPRRIRYIEPVYPRSARRLGVQGTVTIEFTVDTDGNTVNARAVSDAPDELIESAIDAVLKWKFEPKTRNGKPASALLRQTVQFKLEE
jgi:TonB family protein